MFFAFSFKMSASLIVQDIIIDYLEVICVLCIYTQWRVEPEEYISEAVGLLVDSQNRFPMGFLHTSYSYNFQRISAEEGTLSSRRWLKVSVLRGTMKGQHSLSLPKINSYPLLSPKGGREEEQDPGLRLKVFQIFRNRDLGIMKEPPVLRHQVLRPVNPVFGGSPGHLAARERYFKSWQGHVATSKTTPFERQLPPSTWGESETVQEIKAVLWGYRSH